jgi:nucleotide-binding universal stress UspA family protein
VAYDGWEESRVALAEAAALAEGGVADIRVLMVADPHTAASARADAGGDDWLLGHRALADRYLRTVTERLSPRVSARGSVLEGQVAPALASAARAEQLDLLVVGSRRRGPIKRVMLGSASHALLGDPPCALLVCPRGVTAPRETAALAGVERRAL